jgi:ABC-type lipoprotein export system ATPase subunit
MSDTDQVANDSGVLVVCDNVVKIYRVAELEVVALQGLDLTVRRGEVLGLIGVSGSGKSTLMNILGGLDRPSAGRVRVDGADLLKLSARGLDRYRRDKVGFVWQQGARNLVPYLSAIENVLLPMSLAGRQGRTERAWADDLLRTVGLADRRRHNLQQMSGGEQQRVAIAVALANRPPLLLADEPTGELDSVTADGIYRCFHELNVAYGVTIIIVSHDPGLAYRVDRVVEIRDGRTSSETRRQGGVPPHALNGGAHDAEHPPALEELVVVDSAGRLQVPREYLQRLRIAGRVRLELREGEIAIHPAGDPGEGVRGAD